MSQGTVSTSTSRGTVSTSVSQRTAGLGAGSAFDKWSVVSMVVTSSHRDSALAALYPFTQQTQMASTAGTASSPRSPSRAMFEEEPSASAVRESALRCSGKLTTTNPEVCRTLTWTPVGWPVEDWDDDDRTCPPWASTLAREVALASQVYTAGCPVWPVQSTWKPNGSSLASRPSSCRRSTMNTETKVAPSVGPEKVQPSCLSPEASAV
mmetsp:Transcript_34175/g.61257  ORF Transcript_34175/g.61257 Transcript_34175/m.61257 type:complete len:209 (-) Transcript_34175:1360-1986(-)